MSTTPACVLCFEPVWHPESLVFQLCVECRMSPTANLPPIRTSHHAAFIIEVINELGGQVISDERNPVHQGG